MGIESGQSGNAHALNIVRGSNTVLRGNGFTLKRSIKYSMHDYTQNPPMSRSLRQEFVSSSCCEVIVPAPRRSLSPLISLLCPRYFTPPINISASCRKLLSSSHLNFAPHTTSFAAYNLVLKLPSRFINNLLYPPLLLSRPSNEDSYERGRAGTLQVGLFHQLLRSRALATKPRALPTLTALANSHL
jgi:hypothetical protein